MPTGGLRYFVDACLEPVHREFDDECTHRGGEPVGQGPAVSAGSMSSSRAANTGPVSSPASMRMMVTPVFVVSGQYCALNGRRTAPARQQRGVDVDAAQFRRGESGRRQNQAVGHHDQCIEPQVAQMFRSRSYRNWPADGREPEFERTELDGLAASAGRARPVGRLGEHGANLLGARQCVERR